MSNPISNRVIAGSKGSEIVVDKPIDERVQKFVDRALFAGGRPTAQSMGTPSYIARVSLPSTCSSRRARLCLGEHRVGVDRTDGQAFPGVGGRHIQ